MAFTERPYAVVDSGPAEELSDAVVEMALNTLQEPRREVLRQICGYDTPGATDFATIAAVIGISETVVRRLFQEGYRELLEEIAA